MNIYLIISFALVLIILAVVIGFCIYSYYRLGMSVENDSFNNSYFMWSVIFSMIIFIFSVILIMLVVVASHMIVKNKDLYIVNKFGSKTCVKKIEEKDLIDIPNQCMVQKRSVKFEPSNRELNEIEVDVVRRNMTKPSDVESSVFFNEIDMST